MDDHSLHVWRAQAREHGIPEPDIDAWLGLARPALVLHKVSADPAAAAPVVGYRGGHPALPPDVEWSGVPDFVAALDCAALPAELPGFPLPEDGQLLFFHCTEYDGPECDFPEHAGRVLYVPAGTATTERVVTNEHLDEAVRRQVEPERFSLQCAAYWDPPHNCRPIPDGFDQLMQNLADPRPAHARDNEEMLLGGYCNTLRGDPCELAEYTDPEHKKWRRLAFMPRDLIFQGEAMPFLVHWIISEDDLAEHRFDRVRTYTEDLFA